MESYHSFTFVGFASGRKFREKFAIQRCARQYTEICLKLWKYIFKSIFLLNHIEIVIWASSKNPWWKIFFFFFWIRRISFFLPLKAFFLKIKTNSTHFMQKKVEMHFIVIIICWILTLYFNTKRFENFFQIKLLIKLLKYFNKCFKCYNYIKSANKTYAINNNFIKKKKRNS